MTLRATFSLKVWHQEGDEFCSFLLLWDGGSKDIYVSLKYSKELQKRYQRWQQRYFRFYEFLPPQPVGNSGSIKFSSGDPCHDLREAEQDLVRAFQRWLGEGEVRKIQEKVRDELTRITQKFGRQGQGMSCMAGVDIFLTCNSLELARLPWEAWELAPECTPLGTVRLARTSGNAAPFTAWKQPLRRKRPRILAIIGNDPELPLHEDWKTLRSSLKALADVKRVNWQPEEKVVEIKNKIATAISDAQGWDVLFFAGHSDETATGGRLAIAPNLSLSISELEDRLIEARENGLQLAVFNSCSGLPIATKLVELGLQVVVMREPIHHSVAQIFLKQFCQQLAGHQDAHNAWQYACRHLQSVEKFAYPSSYLVPSFFSPASATPYQIKPLGWQRLPQWLPEAIALSAILLLSRCYLVQDRLLETRTLIQAIYRNTTNQFQRDVSPPVLLVVIDPESIAQAKQTIKGFQVKPIDREYLAKLVTRLSDFNASVIGIDYILDTQEPKQEKLATAIQATISQQQTWFVLASSSVLKGRVIDTVASPNWSLQGDVDFPEGDVVLPSDATCVKDCPFAYWLALAHTLQGKSSLTDLPQPNLQSSTDFQQSVSHYLNQGEDQQNAIAFLKRASPPLSEFEVRSIIDFSIPPDQVYERFPAWKFLNALPSPELRQKIKPKVVIVATGGYSDADDNHRAPLALSYWNNWCHPRQRQEKKTDCRQVFTGGQTQAYMVHHLLMQHRVILIPDFWMIGIAAIVGKWAILILLRQPPRQRQQQTVVWIGATTVYGLVGLQVYISAAISLPWLLPSALFWAYILPVVWKK